ncbi:hypothetical protein DUNSADRAFT_13149 [Dunaliella salina]|uniref:Uncharacterized protein n=1 Tax=Dunaliella salina TaxID=3046 RepID=A0ABQ7G9Y4_DUNSA|nr:hypothetical protein DUNSADRAFT_13149 [Dunaliella salina]|eukprot:KAF5831414.1 hypothetical protein DUNSADRAFT_13149 [Dunaliella salina]
MQKRGILRPHLVSIQILIRPYLEVANNKVTRATATVDSLMFQSIVSPGKAVKMIEQIVIPAMLRFYPRGSSQMRWWHKVFEQLYEYFGKDALDALMCVSARAEVVRHPEPKPSTKLQAARMQAQKAQQQRQQQQLTAEERTIEGLESWVAGSKLRVVLTGGSSYDHGPAGGSSVAAQAQATPNLLGQVAPIYVVNDVNLLTLMDTRMQYEAHVNHYCEMLWCDA